MEKEQAYSSLGGLCDSHLDSTCSVPRRSCRQSSDTSVFVTSALSRSCIKGMPLVRLIGNTVQYRIKIFKMQ